MLAVTEEGCAARHPELYLGAAPEMQPIKGGPIHEQFHHLVGRRRYHRSPAWSWTDAKQGIVLNTIVSIVGAMLGGRLLSPLFGAGSINQGDFSLGGLISFLGALILLAVVNLIRRGVAQ
jgi:uncharacterized membrane protein YeaQ/YmgE (transglycosylase-associated protein family)